MHIKYSDRLKQSPEEYALAQYGSNRLEAVTASIEELPKDVDGEWDRTADEDGHPLLTLRLSKRDGDTAIRKIPADQLRSRIFTDMELYGLWGDLVQVDITRRVARFGSEN